MGLGASVCLFRLFSAYFAADPQPAPRRLASSECRALRAGSPALGPRHDSDQDRLEHSRRKAAAADFHSAGDGLAPPIDATASCWTGASRELSVVLRNSSALSRARARVPLSLSFNVRG